MPRWSQSTSEARIVTKTFVLEKKASPIESNAEQFYSCKKFTAVKNLSQKTVFD